MKLCHFPWDSAAFIPPYPNLVHLTLDQLAPNIPIVKVLSILSLSPKLEHVSLSNDPTLLPQHHHFSSSSLDGCSIQAALPRLTTLGLTGDASFVCGLLSRISHPPSTNLRIVCKGEWPAVEGSHPYSPLLDLVGITTTNPLYLASVVSLQIKGPMSMFNDDLYLVLKMHNQASNTEELHRGAPSLLPSLLPIKSVGSLRIAASASLAGGASFFGALQIQGLLELRVELEHRGERGTPLAQCNWGAFFRRHPFISSLHITGWKYAAVKILQGLHGDISVPADSRSRDNLGAGNQRTTIGSRIMRGFKHMALKSQSTSSQDDEGLADIDTSHSNVASLLSPAAALRHLTFVSGLRCLSIVGPDDIDIALGVTRAIRAVFVARRDQAPLSTLKVEGLTVPFSKFPYMKEISLVRKEVEGVCRGKTEFCWE
ncbi:hypothetical protein BDV98DRAFT_189237 [Pterulicium gracile]|uniref:Uncharacterized protein n=1 Tax=Pterulicium gracile TaxID=1884261 RepID=A0A5C3QBF4_9AGAR|nr:hypothetical protein BDV98DRAFT_189237 [Pterula gracilis]